MSLLQRMAHGEWLSGVSCVSRQGTLVPLKGKSHIGGMLFSGSKVSLGAQRHSCRKVALHVFQHAPPVCLRTQMPT